MSSPATEPDPITRRRETARRLATAASRTGYLLILVAVVVFFVALATDFSPTLATIVIASLIAGCVLLAPAIVIGYGVKAAEREDRQRSR